MVLVEAPRPTAPSAVGAATAKLDRVVLILHFELSLP